MASWSEGLKAMLLCRPMETQGRTRIAWGSCDLARGPGSRTPQCPSPLNSAGCQDLGRWPFQHQPAAHRQHPPHPLRPQPPRALPATAMCSCLPPGAWVSTWLTSSGSHLQAAMVPS